MGSIPVSHGSNPQPKTYEGGHIHHDLSDIIWLSDAIGCFISRIASLDMATIWQMICQCMVESIPTQHWTVHFSYPAKVTQDVRIFLLWLIVADVLSGLSSSTALPLEHMITSLWPAGHLFTLTKTQNLIIRFNFFAGLKSCLTLLTELESIWTCSELTLLGVGGWVHITFYLVCGWGCKY